MGYVIEQIGGFLKVTLPGGTTRHYLASDTHVEQRTTDGKVQIYVDNHIQECFDYTEVDTPLEVSNLDLISSINVLISAALTSMGGGIGSATEATLANVLIAVDAIDTNTSGAIETPGLTIATAAGSVASGASTVSIFNDGSASGTVLGTSLTKGLSVSYQVSDLNNTLSAIAYDATGTTFLISETR